MNKLIERNLEKQINEVMQQIKNCREGEFESLVYKYNVFNNIKNTFDEEIVEVGKFKELLEQDKNILEKIYNKFLNVNIIFAPKTFDDVMLENFLTEINTNYNRKTEFSSGTYKGIYYCVMDDCDENKGGYYIEFHRDLQNEYGEVDFDERLDYMVIHVDDEYEMSNPQKVVEEHIDNLIIELEKRNEEIQDEETI